MKRRDFLKFLGLGLAASVATRTANARVCERQDALLDRMWPIGSVYISVDAADPRTRFGGNWQRFGQGRTLVGVTDSSADADFGVVQRTGGARTHTLTEPEMPAHNHSGGAVNGFWVNRGGLYNLATRANTESAGGNQPHNNLPPYITVFIWRRTS